MVLLASRFSTYAAPGFLLLITSYTSTFLRVAFAEDIHCSLFVELCFLCAAPFFLLTTCTRSYLGAVRYPITFQFFLPVGWSFFFCCFPLVSYRSRTRCLMHAIGYDLHAAQCSPITFFGSRLFAGKSPCAPQRSFLAVFSVLLTCCNSLMLISLCWLCSPFPLYRLPLDVHS